MASPPMFLPLTTSTASPPCKDPSIVGGKAASLAKLSQILSGKVPQSFALTVDFFQSWVELLQREFNAKQHPSDQTLQKMQQRCHTLVLSKDQETAIQSLLEIFEPNSKTLLAVRSSAPQEDGISNSFAGAFVTKLGVQANCDSITSAIRSCFASRWDPRVMAYMQTMEQRKFVSSKNNTHSFWERDLSFAVVVMEMIDSEISGVAFTANPLNSDRDELVVDSSWGLGESVVDGSVLADRFVYDKLKNKITSQTIGRKTQEQRLQSQGTKAVEITSNERQTASSLTEEQLHELAKVACVVEQEYGIPMDLEFAFFQANLYLLQARPITTLFTIDDKMMTKPGEKRVLYYDYNIVSDATTTDPFMHMDMEFYGWASSAMMGLDHDIFTTDPNMPLFKASTRQYGNMSIFLKYMSTEYCAQAAEVLDPYLASIFASKDCDRDMYRMKKLPPGVGLWGACKLLWQFPMRKLYNMAKLSKKNPEQAKIQYQEAEQQDMDKFRELDERGPNPGQSLQEFTHEVFLAMKNSFEYELAIVLFVALPLYKELDKQRREGETEEIRSEYDALCGGYVGDGLMQMNIDMYNLAKLLPEKVWVEYPHKDLDKLAHRIESNLNGQEKSDLPIEFLKEWTFFMDRHGWDGQNQLFASCPRYRDNSVLLLAKLRHNVGKGIRDPSGIQREQVDKRREAMASQLEAAQAKGWWSRSSAVTKIQEQNGILENLMWIRNGPKLHLSHMCGILRSQVQRVEKDWLQAGRLEQEGDIFHISFDEIDEASQDNTFDLMALIRPRKFVYERAVQSNQCPILVDSRCRIIKPDPPQDGEHEPDTIVGAAVSPGVATGCVRVIHSPSDEFEQGEVLVAVVTGPAWTPLFVGASAIVLQIGGALQHGALCAREFGKPAVSNIDISLLKTGMEVSVDGNTGVVKILSEDG